MIESQRENTIFFYFLLATIIKFLLINCYKSTDFEVHRNWLSITYSTSLKDWYFEETSQWTLDYPPLFAYFEWVLSRIASRVDMEMVTTLSEQGYNTAATVLFQRFSVIFMDLFLLLGAWAASKAFSRAPCNSTGILESTPDEDSLATSVTNEEVENYAKRYYEKSRNRAIVDTEAPVANFAWPGTIEVNGTGNQDMDSDSLATSVSRGDLQEFLSYVKTKYSPNQSSHSSKYGDAENTARESDESSWSSERKEDTSEESNDTNWSTQEEELPSQSVPLPSNEVLLPNSNTFESGVLCAALILLSPGLFFVDHIHFQYNGFLLGLLLCSVALMKQERFVLAGAVYAILLMLKHLYLPLAPVYFIYLLKRFVLGQASSSWQFRIIRFLVMGSVVLSIFGMTLLPFLLLENSFEQFTQMLSRLFPFGRGLCHAYWAPNVWALYMFSDRVLLYFMKKLGVASPEQMVASSTGGLVHDLPPAVLPRVGPVTCMLCVVLAIAPALFKLWREPQPRRFVWALIHAAFAAFMFGYHVHEKAILTALVPFAVLALDSRHNSVLFLLFSNIAVFSLHPLLPKTETHNKVFLFLGYEIFAEWAIATSFPVSDKSQGKQVEQLKHSPGSKESFLSRYFSIDAVHFSAKCGILGLFLLTEIGHPLLFSAGMKGKVEEFEFLPFMMTSVLCSIALLFCWSVILQKLLF